MKSKLTLPDWFELSDQDKLEIFNESVIGHLFDSSLQAQFPMVYRVFISYCYLVSRLTRDRYIRGAQKLFHIVSKISALSFLSQNHLLKLKIDWCEVFLDLSDARFLRFIDEIKDSHPDIQILKDMLNEGDTFLDAGANHGAFSIVASQIVGKNGLVVAIEPQPRLYEAVRNSLQANAFSQFQVYQVAVGNSEGEVEFLIPIGYSGPSGVYGEHSGVAKHKKTKVLMKKCDELCDWKNIPGKLLVKLDIEGSEYDFLLGARKMIELLKPNIIIEIHPKSIRAAGKSINDLIALLQDLGYKSFAEIVNLNNHIPLQSLTLSERHRNVVLFAR